MPTPSCGRRGTTRARAADAATASSTTSALAALHLRQAHGLGRVAIVDWDVHHGNGTQETFWSDPTVLTISVHQEDLFPPASGLSGDVGGGAGAGANINVPLPAGPGGPRTSTSWTASWCRRWSGSLPSSSSSPVALTPGCSIHSGG